MRTPVLASRAAALSVDADAVGRTRALLTVCLLNIIFTLPISSMLNNQFYACFS